MKRNGIFKGWNWMSFFIGILLMFLFIAFTPQGRDVFYEITETTEGWDGICTQEIIDECCDENVTVHAGNCPDIDPSDIPYKDHPYWELEDLGYDLVGACATGSCSETNEHCYPLIEWDDAKGDWYFTQCVCLEPSDLNCNDQTTQSSCEQHFCVGSGGYQQGYAKKCMWFTAGPGDAMFDDFCWCPFDPL